jgi:hypothetical protein
MASVMSAGGLRSAISIRVTFHAPGIGRGINDVEQAGVDVIAVGQDLVEVHRADHGTDVGQREVLDCVVKIVDLIGCGHRVDHLDKDDGIAGHHGIVLCDDFLLRNIKDRLHHVHFPPHPVDEGRDDRQAGRQRLCVTAKPFNREIVALRHKFECRNQTNDRDGHYQHDHCKKRIHGVPLLCYAHKGGESFPFFNKY